MTHILGLTQREEKALENKLKSIYLRADKEVQEKINKYLAEFEPKDIAMRKKLESGEITEKQYIKWRKKEAMNNPKFNAMQRRIAHEYVNADKIAVAYLNGRIPEQFVSSFVSAGKAIEKQVAGYSFDLVDARAVKKLATERGNIKLGKVSEHKVEYWVSKKARAEILQGIVQGESVDKVAKRLENVTGAEYASSVRTARTLMNGAHNSGRQEAYNQAEKDGILQKKQWRATHDSRTRDSHAYLDGEIVELDERFSNGLMFPQDPEGEASEIYNCRCRVDTVIKGFRNKYTGKSVMYDDMEAEDYEAESKEYWERVKEEKQEKEEIIKEPYSVGSKFNHSKFGEGTILQKDNGFVEIDFDGEIKKLSLEYLPNVEKKDELPKIEKVVEKMPKEDARLVKTVEKYQNYNMWNLPPEIEYQLADEFTEELANKDNFFMNSVGFWKKTTSRTTAPDYISYSRQTGKISSQYWYTEEGVYRESNHWGSRVASCSWFIEGREYTEPIAIGEVETAFISWNDLKAKGKVFRDVSGKLNKKGFEFDLK